jgi:hypothetical protein
MFPSEIRNICKQFTGKVELRKVRLNQGGYTSDGIYFGVGTPLYFAQDEEGYWCDYFRATCREEAIDILRDTFPVAKIRK